MFTRLLRRRKRDVKYYKSRAAASTACGCSARATASGPTSVGVLPNGTRAYVTNLQDGTVTVLNIAG